MLFRNMSARVDDDTTPLLYFSYFLWEFRPKSFFFLINGYQNYFLKVFSRIYPLVLLLLRNANYNYGKYQEKIASKPLLVFLNAYVLLLECDRDRLAGEAGGVFRYNVLLRLRSRIKIRLIIRQSVPLQLCR